MFKNFFANWKEKRKQKKEERRKRREERYEGDDIDLYTTVLVADLVHNSMNESEPSDHGNADTHDSLDSNDSGGSDFGGFDGGDFGGGFD